MNELTDRDVRPAGNQWKRTPKGEPAVKTLDKEPCLRCKTYYIPLNPNQKYCTPRCGQKDHQKERRRKNKKGRSKSIAKSFDEVRPCQYKGCTYITTRSAYKYCPSHMHKMVKGGISKSFKFKTTTPKIKTETPDELRKEYKKLL